MGKRDNARLLVELSPEVLQEKFLDWQCQSRIQAFRTENGRPNSSMMPFLLDKKGNELSKIISKKFQTISYFGFEKNFFEDFFKSKFIDGVDRVVPIGSGLNIDLIWDGYNIIQTLSKVKSIE